MNFQLAKRAETKAIKRPGKKPNELLVKKYSKETNAREYATAKFQTLSSTVWKCQFCKSSRRCRHSLRIHPKSPKFLLDMRYFCNFSLVSLGIRPRSRRCAERTRKGEGRWSRPPKAVLEPSYIRPRIPVPRIACFGRDKKLLTKYLTPKKDYIYIYGFVSLGSHFTMCGIFSFHEKQPRSHPSPRWSRGYHQMLPLIELVLGFESDVCRMF